MTSETPALPSPSGNFPIAASAIEQGPRALDFCRECLGWPEAYASGKYVFENRRRPELPHAHGKLHGFQIDAGDFGNVMNAVKHWCDVHALTLSLKYSQTAGRDWHARLGSCAEAVSADPCDVLLLACLMADRILGKDKLRPLHDDAQKCNPAGTLRIPLSRAQEEAALAFAKECLGWKDARIINDFGYVYIREDFASYPVTPRERSFHFNENHVDKVLEAARAWCEARSAALVLEYFPSGSAADCWRASVGQAQAHSEVASAALVSACLTANRKLTLTESPPCPNALP